jgi:hypothetical protein
MLELMSLKALDVGSTRRHELAVDAMRAARASDMGLRRLAGAVVVAIGNWIAGERATAGHRMRTTVDRA